MIGFVNMVVLTGAMILLWFLHMMCWLQVVVAKMRVHVWLKCAYLSFFSLIPPSPASWENGE